MSTYKEKVLAMRRLTILRLLHEAPKSQLNSSVLRAGMHTFGFGMSMDELSTDLAWLEEQQLVALEDLGVVHVARLRTRGADVAEGNATVPGVAKPSLK